MKILADKIVSEYVSRFPEARVNEPLAKHTTFRLGGPARLYVVAASSERLVAAIDLATELDIPWYVFGGGTNLLVSEAGFAGVTIQAANKNLQIKSDGVNVESGAISALVARQTVEAGLAGFEWAIGLPGTVGGAIYGDAGCFGGEMRDAVVSVDAYHVATRERRQFTNEECQFGYRDSAFKHERFVILGCALALRKTSDVTAARARLEHILAERRAEQPLGAASAGCVFKNFEYQDERALEVLRRDLDVPEDMLAAKRIPAGWLIDQAGLKGQMVGGFEVSERHGNFFLNKAQGRAEDVLALISLVKMKVRDLFGIQLEEEVQLLGF